MLLCTTYLGPVSWFAAFIAGNEVVIDRHEHYIRQTWRNRCRIVGPNGIQDLVIPVRLKGNHTPVGEALIDYSERWQQKHWGAFYSAYGQSPFFDFYAGEFEPFYQRKDIALLVEYNAALLDLTLRLMKAKTKWKFSGEFVPYAADDSRLRFSPRKTVVPLKPYIQVFGERHGFISNLSISDLLFCCGPASVYYLAFA
jgi:hypothetical protein